MCCVLPGADARTCRGDRCAFFFGERHAHVRLQVSWSESPEGPWQTQDGTRDGWGLNNPAAHFQKNGSVLMLYKSTCDHNPHNDFCRQFAVASCATFKGPCTPLRKIPVFGEDAGLWRDHRGNFHIFFHGGNYAPCVRN